MRPLRDMGTLAIHTHVRASYSTQDSFIYIRFVMLQSDSPKINTRCGQHLSAAECILIQFICIVYICIMAGYCMFKLLTHTGYETQ